MSRVILTTCKYENEILDQSVDFVNVLDAGETISSRAVTAKEQPSGTDMASMLSSVGGSGSQVSYTISGGTAGKTYFLDVAATLNTSEVRIQRVQLQVESP